MSGPAAVDVDSNSWLRRLLPRGAGGAAGATGAAAVARLVCFPHAGGSATYFAPFARALAPAVDVLGVQYPGRQDRRREAFVEDAHRLADQATAALALRTDGPYALFGHSLGAVLAYEVACRLQDRGTPVAHLIVSGRRAPSVQRQESVHLRSDAGLVAELRRIGGTHAGFLDDAEIVAMILPVTRADYRAVETYRPVPGPLLTCPVTVLLGDQDPYVSAADAAGWSTCTSGPFALREYAGGHFFLDDHRAAVCAGLAADLTGKDPQ